MKHFILILSLILSASGLATEKAITSVEDKTTLMGTVEFPLDVSQTEAIEIAKFIKKEIKFDQVTVLQISGRRHGIFIQSKYEGGEKAVGSLLEKMKSSVTKKFGKNTIASWSISGTVYTVH
jgi:hypothetical protein